MRKRSSDASICSSIFGTEVAVRRCELVGVAAPVAVLRRLLATANRLDRLAEAVHLRARVVVVVLALDVVAGERKEPRDRVAVRAVPRRRDGDRPGRVRRDGLDLEALARYSPAGPVVATCREDLRRVAVPLARDPEVHEPRPRDLRAL